MSIITIWEAVTKSTAAYTVLFTSLKFNFHQSAISQFTEHIIGIQPISMTISPEDT